MIINLQTYIAILVLSCIFLLGIGVAATLDRDFGNVDVKTVSIPDGDLQISGLLYRPQVATSENLVPAVVLVHGISNAKEAVSGIALELARRGFVALAVDLVGHGSSEGRLGNNSDSTLGTLAAVQYLRLQEFVNASSIGLVGHSLGAGAIRVVDAAQGNIFASVFIGGGIEGTTTGSTYGTLNSTFPKNLLVVVGKYDVLFNLTQLQEDLLPPTFGTIQKVETDVLYGSFSSQTARKLVVPATTHLFEPVDPTTVSQIVAWMSSALGSESARQSSLPESNLIYLYREIALLISLVAFVDLVFPISTLVLRYYANAFLEKKIKAGDRQISDWKVLIILGGLGLALYLPMVFAGLLINFPPLIFGSSIAWWMVATGIAELLVLLVLSKFSSLALNIKAKIFNSFNRLCFEIAAVMFVLLYIIASYLGTFTSIDLRIIVPLFRGLTPMPRVLMFFLFLPFFAVYFLAEGLYLHELRRERLQKSGFWHKLADAVKTVSIKVVPYVLIVSLQYIPLVLAGVGLFPSFVAFLVEFFWLIIPIFVISTACSWWFYRKTHMIGLGVIFNSLLFAWTAVALFPF